MPVHPYRINTRVSRAYVLCGDGSLWRALQYSISLSMFAGVWYRRSPVKDSAQSTRLAAVDVCDPAIQLCQLAQPWRPAPPHPTPPRPPNRYFRCTFQPSSCPPDFYQSYSSPPLVSALLSIATHFLPAPPPVSPHSTFADGSLFSFVFTSSDIINKGWRRRYTT